MRSTLSSRWLLGGFLGVLFVANVLDMVMTRAAIEAGFAYEANPIMAPFIGTGTDVLLKVGFVAAFCVAAFYLVRSRWLMRGIEAVTILYTGIVVYSLVLFLTFA